MERKDSVSGKGKVGVRGPLQVRGWLPGSTGPLTMVISRRGGGLCLILGDPIKRRDLMAHTCGMLQTRFLRGSPGKICSVLLGIQHHAPGRY